MPRKRKSSQGRQTAALKRSLVAQKKQNHEKMILRPSKIRIRNEETRGRTLHSRTSSEINKGISQNVTKRVRRARPKIDAEENRRNKTNQRPSRSTTSPRQCETDMETAMCIRVVAQCLSVASKACNFVETIKHPEIPQTSAENAPVPPRPVCIDVPPADPQSNANVQFEFAIVDGVLVPQIFRISNNERIPCVVVWIVEMKLLWRFPGIKDSSELKKLPPLAGFSITEDEGRLMNEINEMHLCFEYGSRDFTKKENMLVRFQDFITFYNAVVSCYPRIVNNEAVEISRDELNSLKGGFLQIQDIKCPYVSRRDLPLVPLAYLIHSDINLNLPDRTFDNFGFRPSPKECAFLNVLNERFGFKLQIGLKSKLICVDMIEKLADVIIMKLPSQFVKHHLNAF